MTATASPSCSERAQTTSPISDSTAMTAATGAQHEQPVGRQVARQGLDRDVRGAPLQAGGRGEQDARARPSAGRRDEQRTSRARPTPT